MYLNLVFIRLNIIIFVTIVINLVIKRAYICSVIKMSA